MFIYTTRIWITFLINASYGAGLVPMSKQRLHRLVFLSNCLAPLFEATPNTAQIVKYKHGPYYPRVQWELDRLATMGVLTVADLNYSHNSKGWWLNANYGVGPLGPSVIEHCRRVRYGELLGEYLTEVATGFASLRTDPLDLVSLRDENYNRAGTSDDSFIDFSESQKNFSLQTANAFRIVLPPELIPTRKEELFLYMRFLEALETKKAV